MGRKKCPICKSTKWRRDPMTGLPMCSEGHVAEGRQETREEDGSQNHMASRRTIRKEAEFKERNLISDNFYTGDKLRYLHLQCQQLLLRKQIKAIIILWDLPPEIETVAKDLWAMRLSLLKDLRAAPLEAYNKRLADQIDENDDTKDDEKYDIKMEPYLDEPDHGIDDVEDNSTENSENDDPELQTESQTMEQALKASKKRTKRKSYAFVDETNMIWLLSIIYLSLWILKIPIFYSDLKHAIEERQIPFMDGLRHLPSSMTSKFNPMSKSSFESETVPSLRKLYRASLFLARQFKSNYDIEFGEFNTKPILWRCIYDLGLSPKVYTVTKNLMNRLGLKIFLLASENDGNRFRHRKGESQAPEILIMGAVVVVCTLIYDLDTEATNTPRLRTALDKNKWLYLLENEHEKKKTIMNDGIDVIDATEEQIDEFLDYCERTIPPSEELTKIWPCFEDELLSTGKNIDAEKRIEQSSQSKWFEQLYNQRIPNEEVETAPKTMKIYSTSDSFGEYPVLFDKLLKISSKIIDINHVEELELVVEIFQRRLGRIDKNER